MITAYMKCTAYKNVAIPQDCHITCNFQMSRLVESKPAFAVELQIWRRR